MKKILSLLLALTLMFALCGCGSRFLTQEEKEAIYEEVKQQKEAESTAENTEIEKPADESIAEKTEVADADEVVSGSDTEAVEDDFTVEDFEITEISANGINYRVKIRNNSDTDYLMCFFGCQLLDESGETISTIYCLGNSLLSGQSSWADNHISEDDCKNAVAIRFVSYYFDTSMMNGSFFNYKAEFSLLDSSSSSDDLSGNITSESASTKSDYVSIDAICVDDSYRDNDNSPVRMVYLFYTVTAQETNLKIDSKMDLKIGANEYSSARSFDAKKFIKNYYNSIYLENVYVGTSLKVLSSFSIPEGDLTPGKAITLSKTEIPDVGNLSLSTNDIQHFNGIEEIAAAIDPDGYKEMVYLREEADTELSQKVKSAINGYEFSGWVSNLDYTIKFRSGNKFSLTISPMGGGEGTYSVRNGYIFCTYDSTGVTLEIPYEFKDNGKIDLDIAFAFTYE